MAALWFRPCDKVLGEVSTPNQRTAVYALKAWSKHAPRLRDTARRDRISDTLHVDMLAARSPLAGRRQTVRCGSLLLQHGCCDLMASCSSRLLASRSNVQVLAPVYIFEQCPSRWSTTPSVSLCVSSPLLSTRPCDDDLAKSQETILGLTQKSGNACKHDHMPRHQSCIDKLFRHQRGQGRSSPVPSDVP